MRVLLVAIFSVKTTMVTPVDGALSDITTPRLEEMSAIYQLVKVCGNGCRIRMIVNFHMIVSFHMIVNFYMIVNFQKTISKLGLDIRFI